MAGAGVARGYLNRSGLTAEKFIAGPFTNDPHAILYRSGDLGRFLADGDIEYLGRMDDQVKIRGFRIELGEVRTALLNRDDVSQAVVIADRQERRSYNGSPVQTEQRLVAYLVTRSGASLTISHLRRDLEKRLPEYMIPAAFVFLKQIPLTPNGKLDRRELPPLAFDRPFLDRSYAPPETLLQKGLAKIFEDVLQVENVGLHDSFFQLGGHSLDVTRLAVRIRKKFQADIPLPLIFEQPTVAQLAHYVETASLSDRGRRIPEIKPAARTGPLPVSYSQERIWFILQLNPGCRAYDFQSLLRFTGKLDVRALEQSLCEIVKRHEIYRTTFHQVEGRLCQVVHRPFPVALSVRDLSAPSLNSRDSLASRMIRQAAERPFHLEKLPLIRWKLLRLQKNVHILSHFEHHIIHDGWSFVVFLGELMDLYRAFSRNRPSPLAEPKIQFADFALWQRNWMQGKQAGRQLDFWKKKLTGCPVQLPLPCDRPRPAAQSFCGDAIRVDVPSDLNRAVDTFSRQNDVTVYMTMLAAFLTLLYRYTNQEDIVVGTGIANRRGIEIESLLGMIINNIALRNDLSGHPSFRELTRRTRKTALEAYDHQDVPFDKVVEAVNPVRNAGLSPIFQTIFTSYDGPVPELALPGLAIELVEGLNNKTAKFDLNIIVISRSKPNPAAASQEAVDTISLIWEYSTDLFDRSTMERMVANYLHVLKHAVRDGEQLISTIPLMTDRERRKLIHEYNRTKTHYPSEATVHKLFEAKAAESPQSVALVYQDQHLTYGQLNTLANRLAHYLKGQGVGPEAMVGICVERSHFLVLGILGILKAGGTYIPLDPGYPQGRLAFMIRDTGLSIVLTLSSLADRLPAHSDQVVCLDESPAFFAGESDRNPRHNTFPNALAYIMYTSGSTGRPKGVGIEHHSIVRLVRETHYVELGAEEVSLQFAPISFDASTFEIWGSLLNGGKLVVHPAHAPSLKALGDFIEKQGVSVLWLTAALFNQMVDECLESLSKVPQILAGGEALSASHVRKMLPRLGRHKLINGYGPTENTTFTTCHTMSSASRIGQTVPIGRPIANTLVYILDDRLQPVPSGVYGELFIGGEGLARGYHGRPALTAEHFIPDPFSRDPGARLYRTGDIVRYLADGRIEFLGRLDKQVKIHGFRVELGEIESILALHPKVNEAVVLYRDVRQGQRQLVAYVVAEAVFERVAEELRGFLKKRLPNYMIPARYILLDIFPLTANGKIDRDVLPEPDGSRPDPTVEFTQPRSDTEQRIVSLWQEMLKVRSIGIHDDFFELGGHSLLGLQVMNRLGDMFQHQFPMNRLFEFPTIAELAAHVDAVNKGRTDGRPASGDLESGMVAGEI